MKIFKGLFIALLFLSFKCAAQQGYDISIDITGVHNKILQLSYYHGTVTKPTVVDSVLIDKPHQHIVFKNEKKIISAVYRIDFKDGGKMNFIDIVVDNAAKLSIALADTNLSAIKASDKMNQLFLQYQSVAPEVGAEEKRKLLNLLNAGYPQSVISLYAKLELKKIEVYAAKQDSVNRKIRDEYFSGIDLKDKRIPLLPDTYSFLNNYFNLLPFNNQNYQDNADLLLKNLDCSNKNYIFYLGWIFKNLDYLERYNLKDAYRYIYSKYLDIEPCKTANQNFYYRITAAYKELDRLIDGNAIPDFNMQDSVGNVYTIQSLLSKSKYTFIAFFDPDCSHCKEMLPQVSRFFDSLNLDKSLVQTISFANSTGLADWQKFLLDSKLQNWFNVKPNNGDQSYMISLKVYTNPCFFLVDDKGIIRLRDFNKEKIEAILKRNNE